MRYLLDNEETARLEFRRIESSDFNYWVPFFKEPKSFTHWKMELREPEVECADWYARQFYRHNSDLGGMNALIEKSSGDLIGHCGLLVQSVDDIMELEIAYSILPVFWNRGYASEAARKCRDIAFKRSYSPSLISIISLTNDPSARVALKNGMHIEKQTMYYDNPVNIFRILKDEWLAMENGR